MCMSKSLILFGIGQIAELAYQYFTHDSDYNVAAFTVDSDYLCQDEYCGLPVIPFEDITKQYPPDTFDLFVALSYSKLNSLRKGKFASAKRKGYKLARYVSSQATVLNGHNIGENCFILENNTIQPFAVIGDNVTIWSGNHIGHHSSIGDHTFIASHSVVSGGVEIGEQCFIGVNATLRDHIKVGDRCVIGAGALLLADAESDGVYIGSATDRSRVPSSRLRNI